MITAIYSGNGYVNGEPVTPIEYRGLSTDSKPTGAQNGDVFIEINTGKVYMYDKTGATWREI